MVFDMFAGGFMAGLFVGIVGTTLAFFLFMDKPVIYVDDWDLEYTEIYPEMYTILDSKYDYLSRGDDGERSFRYMNDVYYFNVLESTRSLERVSKIIEKL